MDKTKYTQERTLLESLQGQQALPNLGDNFEVLKPSTPDYNCIGHSLGFDDQWMNPVTGPSDNPLAVMEGKYTNQGYTQLATLNYNLEPGSRKVVVYATKNPDGSIDEITHAAIQDGHGTWESKLGQGPLIRHQTPDALNGPAYGQPVAVYKKRRMP